MSTGGAAAGAALVGATARQVNAVRLDDALQAVPVALPTPTGSTVPSDGVGVPVDPAGATSSPVTPYFTPNAGFYRIDTAISIPRIDVADWRLEIRGRVDRPLTLTYDDLLAREQVERIVTLACVSNEVGGDLIGNAVWQGVLLAPLLEEAGVQPESEQVFSTSVDGWNCGFPVELAFDGRDAMIAVGMNGEPLPRRHGFPARLVVPGLYGYVSATKWLERIELTTWDEAVGYWIPRGWAREAPIKTQSRIDVPRRGDRPAAGSVVIAGIAWAQHRGITAVEVRIDDGPWQQAELATDVTIDSWRQWRLVWQASPGEHRIQVRATDATGETQTQETSRVDPDGATGWHTRRITVV
jgi:DMSO/TMAO reductase YedYZ molybdopterin-dependent catalytic subunit